MTATETRPLSYTHITYDHTARPKRRQMTFSERRKLGPMACAWLESIGAQRGGYYDYRVDTTYGPLGVTPYDTWIACRFEDATRARPVVGQSFTAKWNHYHFDLSPAGDRPTAAELLAHFQARLSPILARNQE